MPTLPASLEFPASPPSLAPSAADAARMVTLEMESHVKVPVVPLMIRDEDWPFLSVVD